MQDQEHKPYTEGPMHSTAPVIDPGLTFASVTDKISSIVLKRKTSLAWFFGFAISFALFDLRVQTESLRSEFAARSTCTSPSRRGCVP